MNDFESVRNCIIFTFQGPEARQDWVVNAFDQHNTIKWIKVLVLKVLVPLLHVNWNLGQKVVGIFLEFWRLTWGIFVPKLTIISAIQVFIVIENSPLALTNTTGCRALPWIALAIIGWFLIYLWAAVSLMFWTGDADASKSILSWLLNASFIRQKFQKVSIQTDSVLIHVRSLVVLKTFLEKDCEAWEPIEPLWTEISHLVACYTDLRLILLLLWSINILFPVLLAAIMVWNIVRKFKMSSTVNWFF